MFDKDPNEIVEYNPLVTHKNNCTIFNNNICNCIIIKLKLDRFPELQEPAISLMKRVLEGYEQLTQTQAFIIGQLLKEIE